MPNARYTDLQLDALRELANIGSGTAGTALSSLLGSSIELSVPSASALELAEAVEAAGAPEDVVWGVVVPVSGQVDATALLVIGDDGRAHHLRHARRRGRHRHRRARRWARSATSWSAPTSARWPR